MYALPREIVVHKILFLGSVFFFFFQKPESNVFRDLEFRNDEVGLWPQVINFFPLYVFRQWQFEDFSSDLS